MATEMRFKFILERRTPLGATGSSGVAGSESVYSAMSEEEMAGIARGEEGGLVFNSIVIGEGVSSAACGLMFDVFFDVFFDLGEAVFDVFDVFDMFGVFDDFDFFEEFDVFDAFQIGRAHV